MTCLAGAIRLAYSHAEQAPRAAAICLPHRGNSRTLYIQSTDNGNAIVIASTCAYASQYSRAFSRHWPAFAVAFAYACMVMADAPAYAEAQAAQRPPLNIALFISSRNDVCFDPGTVPAIRQLARLEQDRINRQGGIAGRQLNLQFFDDRRDPNAAITNMRSALSDPHMLGMVGLANSTRAKATFDALGAQIRESGIPFLSDISVNSLFAGHDNVFTMRASQDDERMPVLAKFIKEMNVARPAFVGIKDAVFSSSVGDGLKSALGDQQLTVDHRLSANGDALDANETGALLAELKEKQPDLLFLSIGNNRTGRLMRELMAAEITPALFITGRIEAIPAEIAGAYPANMYQLAWDGLPDAYSGRLRKLIARGDPEQWIFEGSKLSEAPGWQTGECQPRPDDIPRNPVANANLRAIAAGAQYGDMIGLIAAAAGSADINADVKELRRHILSRLNTAYATGRGVFQGSFENWSFRAASRTAARTPFIIMRTPGMDAPQLAPLQFVRLKDDSLRPIEALYLDIDLVRAIRVDDNEQTFFAEFYMSMRDSRAASSEAIEFANAFLDPKTNDRQITIRTLHAGGKSGTYPEHMKIYQVSGRFTYEPDLANYPFDVQRFAIDIRPKLSDAPFVVQPPPQSLRDTAVVTDGWDPKDQYVTYDEDFVRMLDARSHEQAVVPFYKASFVWTMKRQTTDYYLRVVVPLAFILIIAYMSIFIPQSHFEAVVTIQVTALLSAVALYLALPKVDSDTATLSDRIFLFNYMAFSLMISLSIVRVSRFVAARKWLQRSLGLVHVVLIPVLVGLMAAYVHRASLSG